MTVLTDIPAGPGSLTFLPFRIDLRGGRLCRSGETIPLRPKTWSVLVHLARRSGALVTKDELLDAVWQGVAVTPDTLTKSIGELRIALGDDAKTPRFIETVHRRGFRFIAPVSSDGSEPGAAAESDRRGEPDARPATAGLFVGRAAELATLAGLLAAARAGERQMVCVSGAAGIGKSALINAFLDSPAVRDAAAPVWVGRGSCIDQHGLREGYLPVLEALERLAHRPDAAAFIELLQRVAPTWLAQMPWLIGAGGEPLRRSLEMARPERMPRELAAAIEALTQDVTLVLVLEDLHWSDPSTVDLLSFLAPRREPARLLIVATYRPADAAVHEHVLLEAVRTLETHRHCRALPLHELDVEDTLQYLRLRFPGARFPASLARLIHAHTDGHPLFITAVVEHMVTRGWILATGPGWSLSVPLERLDLEVPVDIRRAIDTALEVLSPRDRELLEAASVGGVAFAPQAIAAALGCSTADAEMRCEALTRAGRFLRAAGRAEWPDGSVARRYAFLHELYRRTVYAEIPDAYRQRLHQCLGEAIEEAYGEHAGEVAIELAGHFQESRDAQRAVRHLAAAAVRARRRFANHEALGNLESALALVPRLASAQARGRGELELRMLLGPILNDLHGYASDSVGENYAGADSLAARFASPAEHFEIVYALCHYHAARADTSVAAAAARLADLAARIGSDEAQVRADSTLVRIDLVAGRFTEACARMRSRAWPSAASPFTPPADFGPDPVVVAGLHHALAQWFLGYVDPAREEANALLATVGATGNRFTIAAALFHGGLLELFCRDSAGALALGEQAFACASEHGFPYWAAMASAVRGAALVLSGNIHAGRDELQRARGALQATGSRLFATHILAHLADAHLRIGAVAEGLAAVDEGLALAESTIDRTYWPELWRVKGELLLAASPRPDPGAETCLRRAVELARSAQAKSLELRASTSLARALRAGDRRRDGQALLAEICAWFDPAARTADLAAARELLDELSAGNPRRARRQPAHRQRGLDQ